MNNKRKVIIGTCTDSTNVWGYIKLEVINPDGSSGDRDLIPPTIRQATQYQYPSQSHIPYSDLDEIAKKLERLGWEVLDEECNPFWD